MNEAEFASYVEHVFRHHNTVVNNLLFAASKGDDSRDSGLTQAEARMAHACLPLNEVASSTASGKTPDFWTRMRLGDAVPECEAATRKVEELLPDGF